MIYYSHINEDNRIERVLLHEGKFSTAVAICGSGERVLSLMDSKSCNKLVVVDCNEEAIFLLQLKIEALRHFTIDDYLCFIGHHVMTEDNRISLYLSLENQLPGRERAFWKNNLLLIKKGILRIGHFEKFLDRTRPFTNLWLGKNFHDIFKPFTTSPVSSTRWKLLQHLFSYKLVYQLLGNKDIAFTGSSAQLKRIPSALDKIIKNGKASSSFIAHLVFKGHLSEMNQTELPPSLQEKNLAVIKQRLLSNEIKVEYHVADLLQFLQQENDMGSSVFYSVSDILSFDDFDYLHAIIKKTAVNENCIVGRSFLRNRLTSNHLSLFENYGMVSLHDEQESTGMYQVFSLHTQVKDAV